MEHVRRPPGICFCTPFAQLSGRALDFVRLAIRAFFLFVFNYT